nr:ROK family protein [Lysinibacillus timonensis]
MSWNQKIGKKLNKELILQQVLLKSHISRNEIIENTNLKKATVANLVKELIEEQFIVEAGKEQSTGGRRSSLLKLNERAGYALGIDIGVNYLRGIVTNLDGEIVFDIQQEITDNAFENYFNNIIQMIQLLTEEVPKSPYHIIGLGIAVPGTIAMDGTIINAPNLRWHNVDLVHQLKSYVDYPLYISNEANAGAFAEFSFIHNMQHQNMLFVSIGYGIGVGIIINGELYHGELGFSGENGHMIIQMDGKTCKCGRIGCWEAYASEYAFLQEAEKALNVTDMSIEKILPLYANDHNLQKVFTDIGRYIAIGLMNLIYTFNPSKIVIGNRITLLQNYIKKEIFNRFNSQSSSSYIMDQTEIEFSTLQDKAIVVGAALIAINQFLQPSKPGS